VGGLPTLTTTLLHGPIGALLIANRGEIALRIARTCRDLGIRALGVATATDADSLHTRVLDEVAQISDYLDGPAILEAARQMGASAIHPGYGFLAENAAFAQSVIDAGLVWVGPPPAAIAAMGSKAEARRLMAARGVPVIPGFDGEAQDDATLCQAAGAVGFPVLVKASAGGGGKGMQVVRAAEMLPAALAAARRIAALAFGDDRLIIERFIEGPRHIEAQIIADAHGTVLHLLERECSIQRRHQKVIEEAPSPAFVTDEDNARRAALLADAVEAARAVGYVNAGTVEFIVGADGAHYFLEVNTRLQVEHPVTEAVTGVDLVALQIAVAEGRPLPLAQADVQANGHAIEARLYAEDPDAGWLPRVGTLGAFEFPDRHGVRVDAGVTTGDLVGTAFDPMLAKVIAWGPTRDIARRRLVAGLEAGRVLGVQTNQAHLCRTLAHPAFAAGELTTAFLQDHVATLGPEPSEGLEQMAVGVAALSRRPAPGLVPGVSLGWQSNPWPEPPMRFAIGDAVHEVTPAWGRDSVRLWAQAWTDDARPPGLPAREGSALFGEPVQVRLLRHRDAEWRVEVDGRQSTLGVWLDGDTIWVQHRGRTVAVRRLPDLPAPGAGEAEGGLVAPMPGRVVRVAVSAEQPVEAGDVLVVLEAMKMEQEVRAPHAGLVTRVLVAEGDQVDGGQPLVVLEDDSA
jgi:acetyl/propionyl-CoA carboxylase alpha subunit